jgi:hypothetical protein
VARPGLGGLSAGWYRVRTCQAFASIARELPERDDANFVLVVPTHDGRSDAVSGVAVVPDEGDSFASQPELFAAVILIVFHWVSFGVSTATYDRDVDPWVTVWLASCFGSAAHLVRRGQSR